MNLRRIRDNRCDDHGSMSILLLVMLVGLMFGALLVPTVITSSRTTSFDKTRVQALDAAQAGIDVTLGAIRSSVVDGVGTSAKLPCGPGSGDLGGAPALRYTTTLEYLTADPTVTPTARTMKCVAGYGPYDPMTLATTPVVVRVTSTGTVSSSANGAAPGRTLITTYVFKSSDRYTLGGLLPLEGTPALCADAGSATPAAGAIVVLQNCSTATPSAPQQVFAYRTDLTLQLVSSVTVTNPNGMCMAAARTPAVGGDAMVMAQCGPLGSPATYTQQWSYNDNAQYQAAQADSTLTGALPNLCINIVGRSAGQNLVVSGCGTVWRPSAAMGPGAAALPQWVNFAEFGRCLDVTYQDINYPFLISYPCKQNPNPAVKTWNQLFTTPSLTGVVSATGTIVTTPFPGIPYCLTSLGVDSTYVTMKPCVANNPQQTWTLHSGDKSLSYSTKYTIMNGSLCLGLGAPNVAATFSSTILIETCTGAAEQKWNAVASELNSALRDTYEK